MKRRRKTTKPPKPKHPARDMTEGDREVFERIAANRPPRCGWATIRRLLMAGLIERGPSETRPLGLGFYSGPTFHVAASVHQRWARWCKHQYKRRPAPGTRPRNHRRRE